MEVPDSFWQLAIRFHQDILSFVDASETALADYLIRGLGPAERRELSIFLDQIFAMPDPGNNLLRLWSKSRAEFGFSRAADIVGLFRVIHQRLQ